MTSLNLGHEHEFVKQNEQDVDAVGDANNDDIDSVIPLWFGEDTMTYGYGEMQSPTSDATVCLYPTDNDSVVEANV